MAARLEEEYDYEDKRLVVAASFANPDAKYRGRARTEAVVQAAAAHDVSANFVWRYGLQAEMGEGFFEETTWGKNIKTA